MINLKAEVDKSSPFEQTSHWYVVIKSRLNKGNKQLDCGCACLNEKSGNRVGNDINKITELANKASLKKANIGSIFKTKQSLTFF